ncbi:MAG: hypothetical protein IPI67_29665 [Myxococcales bacterium]|nr:hypothetical protein [Myxococcales bacterium]
MPKKTPVQLAVLAAIALSARPGNTQPGATAGAPPAPEATKDCSSGRQGALSELACEVGRALTKLPAGALVVSAPLTTDTKLLDANAFTTRLTSVLAGALGLKSSSEAATLARARTLASQAGTLVHLVPEIRGGELRLTVDVYPVPKSFWDRVRDPEPNPRAHAFASRRLDAELRTFLPPVPLVAKRTDKATSGEQSPVAVACGDVNGDGSLELVLVGRSRVQLGRVRAGRFVASATATWAQLSPLSRSPLREPIGSAWIEPGRWVDVGLSDRLDAVRLDASFAARGKLGRRLPWPGGGCAKIQGTSVRPEIDACVVGDSTPVVSPMERPSDALGGANLVGRDGKARKVRAMRAFNESTVLLRDDAGHTARLEGAGAQLAVGDLDGDGQPEILTSADTLDDGGDALIVHTWQDDSKLVERMRIAVKGGVRALAVCPPEGAGLSPVVVALPGELWVIR